jgi:hypothetical protein
MNEPDFAQYSSAFQRFAVWLFTQWVKSQNRERVMVIGRNLFCTLSVDSGIVLRFILGKETPSKAKVMETLLPPYPDQPNAPRWVASVCALPAWPPRLGKRKYEFHNNLLFFVHQPSAVSY